MPPRPPRDPRDLYLQRLRGWRNRPEADPRLGPVLGRFFKQEVERPHKQLAAIAALWAELVPAELAAATRLEGLTRGVLRVAVDTPAHLYALDRLLRSGAEHDLVTRHRGPAFRRVQLRVAGARGRDSYEAPEPREREPADDE